MEVRIIEDIRRVPERAWNALDAGGCPFLDHRFLAALETSGCVCAQSGWHPQHVALFENDAPDARLLAATPLYLKNHSRGEYVFDWGWARASEQAEIPYYPKLVSAVPMTPVTGPRLLIHPDTARDGTTRDGTAAALVQSALDYARALGVPSLHWLFPDERDTHLLREHALLERHGLQYHWSNPGYESFDDYLAQLSSSKRKKIKRERRRVIEQGIQLQVLREDIPAAMWERLYDFYCSTIDEHGALRYLNRAFFQTLGATMADRTVLVTAELERELVGAALFLEGGGVLYGRYWGGLRIQDLHFEVCYYQAIEYCITHGLARFEAGAQGEHKIARGLTPVLTRSMHWLRHPAMADAVRRFLADEQHYVGDVRNILEEHSPFRKTDDKD